MPEVPDLRDGLLAHITPLVERDGFLERSLLRKILFRHIDAKPRNAAKDSPCFDVLQFSSTQALSQDGCDVRMTIHRYQNICAVSETRWSRELCAGEIRPLRSIRNGEQGHMVRPVFQGNVGGQDVPLQYRVDLMRLSGVLQEEKASLDPQHGEVGPNLPGGGKQQRSPRLSGAKPGQIG